MAGRVAGIVSARVAAPADVGEITRLRALAADDVRPLRGGTALLGSLDAPDSGIAPGDADDRLHLVGVVGEVVVGYGLLVRRWPRADLAELYCERPGRGVGVGHALLELALELATEWGCDAIDSHALPGDRGTKNFFEAHAMVSRLIVVSRSLDAGE